MIVANPAPAPLDGPVVQCAVNLSEGCRRDVVNAIADAMSGVEGAVLADCSADCDHNRMVATLLGRPEAVADAVMAGARVAVQRIDLRTHVGVHPRLGAVDVVPIVPIRDVTVEECMATAADLARRLSVQLELPVFLYERSARAGHRSALPDIRRGGFEGLIRRGLEGDRVPDLGPHAAHPTAGAVVVGAREPLVACNMLLDAPDIKAARGIAAAIRRERPREKAIRGIRALGLMLTSRGLSQVSLNLTRPALTPIGGVFEYVCQEAAARGTIVAETEIIGLAPRACLDGSTPESILWYGHRPAQRLEKWLSPAELE